MTDAWRINLSVRQKRTLCLWCRCVSLLGHADSVVMERSRDKEGVTQNPCYYRVKDILRAEPVEDLNDRLVSMTQYPNHIYTKPLPASGSIDDQVPQTALLGIEILAQKLFTSCQVEWQ